MGALPDPRSCHFGKRCHDLHGNTSACDNPARGSPSRGTNRWRRQRLKLYWRWDSGVLTPCRCWCAAHFHARGLRGGIELSGFCTFSPLAQRLHQWFSSPAAHENTYQANNAELPNSALVPLPSRKLPGERCQLPAVTTPRFPLLPVPLRPPPRARQLQSPAQDPPFPIHMDWIDLHSKPLSVGVLFRSISDSTWIMKAKRPTAIL